jgi:hypothetical protein
MSLARQAQEYQINAAVAKFQNALRNKGIAGGSPIRAWTAEEVRAVISTISRSTISQLSQLPLDQQQQTMAAIGSMLQRYSSGVLGTADSLQSIFGGMTSASDVLRYLSDHLNDRPADPTALGGNTADAKQMFKSDFDKLDPSDQITWAIRGGQVLPDP